MFSFKKIRFSPILDAKLREVFYLNPCKTIKNILGDRILILCYTSTLFFSVPCLGGEKWQVHISMLCHAMPCCTIKKLPHCGYGKNFKLDLFHVTGRRISGGVVLLLTCHAVPGCGRPWQL